MMELEREILGYINFQILIKLKFVYNKMNKLQE